MGKLTELLEHDGYDNEEENALDDQNDNADYRPAQAISRLLRQHQEETYTAIRLTFNRSRKVMSRP